MRYFVGCDLGGTNLRVGLVDVATGDVTRVSSIPTLARHGSAAVIERMAAQLRELLAASGTQPEDVGGLGIGIPGTPDIDTGTVRFMPNFEGQWLDVPLRARLLELTGLHAHLLNDVRAIALGEWRFGAGVGAHTIACLAIGTGIGGGVIIDNRLHLGIGGTAGELGHQTVDPYTEQRCGCGNRGCVEVFAAAPAIAAAGARVVLQGRESLIGRLAEFDLNRVTPAVVAAAAAAGDPEACEIYRRAGYYLGIAVANLLVVISPQRVIIGGGVAQAGDLLLEPVRQTVRERVFMMPQDRVAIVPAMLGDSAGILGAALWAAQRSAAAA